jgi:transcriptional regulator with XRE-family HTH domain
MQQYGYSSSRSTSGVRLNILAKIAGCSQQMARRYAIGEALPEVDVIYKIAKWLDVSPGWLLFGDETKIPNNIIQKDLVEIDPELLKYILQKVQPLYFSTNNLPELVNFIMDIIYDATHIEADSATIQKIVDITVNSATRFNGCTDEKRAVRSTYNK